MNNVGKHSPNLKTPVFPKFLNHFLAVGDYFLIEIINMTIGFSGRVGTERVRFSGD